MNYKKIRKEMMKKTNELEELIDLYNKTNIIRYKKMWIKKMQEVIV